MNPSTRRLTTRVRYRHLLEASPVDSCIFNGSGSRFGENLWGVNALNKPDSLLSFYDFRSRASPQYSSLSCLKWIAKLEEDCTEVVNRKN